MNLPVISLSPEQAARQAHHVLLPGDVHPRQGEVEHHPVGGGVDQAAGQLHGGLQVVSRHHGLSPYWLFIVTLEQSDKHVIQKLKSIECEQYILPWQPVDVDNFHDTSTMIYVNHLLRVQRFPHQIL